MKTSSAKNKGRLLQKYVADTITKTFKLKDGDCVSRPLSSAGVDVMMSSLARRKFPISPECKNTKKFPGLGGLDQSRANAYRGSLPGVVWKPSGKSMKSSMIYFNLEEFVTYWKQKKNCAPKDKEVYDRESLAWAAGFFDGEGTVNISTRRTSCNGERQYLTINLCVSQTDPKILHKFKEICNMGGRVNGPYCPKTTNSSPYWSYAVHGLKHTQLIISRLWPWLSEEKRKQATEAFVKMEEYCKRPQLVRGTKTKLKKEQIEAIKNSPNSNQSLAEAFKVSDETIRRIKNKQARYAQ
jgi:hypothetical protein